jgi:hypothetical protein
MKEKGLAIKKAFPPESIGNPDLIIPAGESEKTSHIIPCKSRAFVLNEEKMNFLPNKAK